MNIQLLVGNALDILKTLPSSSINCCITSPPYYGLRNYDVPDQIGLENSPKEYVDKLVAVFQEVRRVLVEEGTLWLNLGDSYNGSGGPGSQYDTKAANKYKEKFFKYKNPNRNIDGLKPKDLIGIPWMVAFALRDDGWYLRSDIIWYKPNGMPENVKDRPTQKHEYLFLFSKNRKYYCNMAEIVEPYTEPMNRWGGDVLKANGNSTWDEGTKQNTYRTRNMRPNPQRKNKGTVWTVNTKPYRGAHFATYPPELIKPCILAGCPEGGVVLDPFNGAGTTGLVAIENNRGYVGIDINPEYVEITKRRLGLI